jgi:hypothetical protein
MANTPPKKFLKAGFYKAPPEKPKPSKEEVIAKFFRSKDKAKVVKKIKKEPK